MRLFVAIDIAPEVRENLRSFLSRVKPLAKLAWSPVENLHITTKFIGEWPEAKLGVMEEALRTVQSPAMEIRVSGLGWFPNDRRPRVFWAGIHGSPELAALAEATSDVVEKIGVPKEDRAYSPHLTLARVRELVPLDELRKAAQDADFGVFTAHSFFLYLSANGKYTKLSEYRLRMINPG